MGAVEHWRLRKQRYGLIGERRELEDGKEEFSLTGANWVESPNGRHRGENPLEGKEIYKAQNLFSDNGREPVEVRGTVEISASED